MARQDRLRQSPVPRRRMLPTRTLPAENTTAIAPTPAVVVPVKVDSQERTIVVENALYRVEISNRGGVVKSWQLKKYKDDAKPPRVLDVVHPQASAQIGGWPFSVVLDDAQLEAQANSGLYVAEFRPEPGAHAGDGASAHLAAPSGKSSARLQRRLQFTWSDGHLEVTKSFQFDHSYVMRVETSVKFNGTPLQAGLGVAGRLRRFDGA